MTQKNTWLEYFQYNLKFVKPTPSQTVHTTREDAPTQLVIPGAGLAPKIGSTPALEEAIATEKYMGTRPGSNLKMALQKALSRAATTQLKLF